MASEGDLFRGGSTARKLAVVELLGEGFRVEPLELAVGHWRTPFVGIENQSLLSLQSSLDFGLFRWLGLSLDKVDCGDLQEERGPDTWLHFCLVPRSLVFLPVSLVAFFQGCGALRRNGSVEADETSFLKQICELIFGKLGVGSRKDLLAESLVKSHLELVVFAAGLRVSGTPLGPLGFSFSQLVQSLEKDMHVRVVDGDFGLIHDLPVARVAAH